MRDHAVTEWTHPLPPPLMFAFHLKKQVLEKDVTERETKKTSEFLRIDHSTFRFPAWMLNH